jgi:hypothetical protein
VQAEKRAARCFGQEMIKVPGKSHYGARQRRLEMRTKGTRSVPAAMRTGKFGRRGRAGALLLYRSLI